MEHSAIFAFSYSKELWIISHIICSVNWTQPKTFFLKAKIHKWQYTYVVGRDARYQLIDSMW